jgi:Fe-S cluster assembly protein SufD
MSAVESTQPYLERFAALERELAGQPQWLATQRQEALARFSVEGFPDPRAEEWRYTNVRPIIRQAFRPASKSTSEFGAVDLAVARIGELEHEDLVFVNGRFRPELSSPTSAEPGTRIRSLASLIAEEPERLQGLLGSVVSYTDNPFAALNGAFIGDGAVIDVAAEHELQRPIRLLMVSTAESEPVESHPRILIRLGRHAKAAVIEHYLGFEGARNFCNGVTEVCLEEGAQLEHYRLQQESAQGFLVASLHATVKHDARLVSHNVNLGGRLVRQDLNVRLDQPGATTELNGLVVAGDRQHVDNHTRIHHAAAHTSSQEDYKCVLDGHARGVFKGRVLVERDAQKIEAHQISGNLLLSDTAEVDTKPELEIYADDVICSHGATVGQLDESSLFYLRSRAIDEQTARSLLIFAFADEVISRMGLGAVRGRLEEIIVGRLPDSETLKGFV